MKHKNNPFKGDLDESLGTTENAEQNTEELQELDTEPCSSDENSGAASELQKKYDTLNQQYLRLAADFDNYRKRQTQEREDLLKYGAETSLTKMIEILDNFERGIQALENVDDCEKIKESFKLVYKQVTETLSKLGLEEIKAEGEVFDPNFHEAVMQTPSDEIPENTVIKEMRKGYKLGDKILRPSMVNVSSGN